MRLLAESVTALVAVAALLIFQPNLPAQDPKDEWEARFRALEERYQLRVNVLESRLSEVEAELRSERSGAEERALAGEIERLARQGLRAEVRSSTFSNVWNPAISVLGDFVFAWSDRRDSRAELDRFILREIELGLSGRVDPFLAWYVFIHFDEEEVELEEAYGIVDSGLPDTFTLKAGRYNVDFGKLSPVHDAELPFVDKPGVLQEYLGGSLRGTGVELHHWFPLAEDHLLRWSLGLVNSPDGDVHPVLGVDRGGHHHEEDLAVPGKRGFDDFALTARVSALIEVGSATTLQVGSSLLWAPHQRGVEGPGKEDGPVVDLHAFDRHRRTIGLDLLLRERDPVTGTGWSLGGELLFHREEFGALDAKRLSEGPGLPTEPSRSESSVGFYVYGEWLFDPRWSLGASFDWFERKEDSGLVWWDAGVFVTHTLDEFHRLRLELRYVDDEARDDRFVAAILQWTVVLGSHSHGIGW
jgi:hypothetical protein